MKKVSNFKVSTLDNFWKFGKPRLANMLISPTIYENSPNYLNWVFLIRILFIRNIGVKQAKKKNGLGIMIRLTFKNSFHRSSHKMCSVKEGVLKKFTKFTGKQLCQSLFLNKVAGLLVFNCESCKIFKNIFLTEQLRVTASASTKLLFFKLVQVLLFSALNL